MWFAILFCGFIAMLMLHYIKSEIMFRKFPSGPPRLPIVGSLPYFIWAGGSVPSHAYKKMALKYGSIFGIKLGSVPAIVLNSHEAIQSIAFHPDLQVHLDQDETWLLSKSKGIPAGLFFTSPTQWKDQLAIGHKLLRKYGFKSSQVIESLIISEMTEFCQDLKNSIEANGEVFRIVEQFHAIFFNVMWGFITGRRCEKDDPFLSKIVHTSEEFLRSSQFGGGIHNIFPELVRWFPRLTGFRVVQKVCEEWFTAIEGAVKNYRKLGNYKTNPSNMIEDYLALVDKHGNENANSHETIYTDLHIVGYVQDLLLGGVDTQSHTMKFLLRFFIKYPYVQQKIRQEVQDVIGEHGLPISEEIDRLIYTQATFLEIFRMEPIVEISLRKIWRPTKFEKYELPKGTMVYTNLYAANRQESVWPNPYLFQPERFISADGKIVNSDKILTFGFGKRPCIGEAIAKRNLVVATALLVQQFTFSEDPASGIPEDKDVVHSITQDLPPFNVIVKIRK